MLIHVKIIKQHRSKGLGPQSASNIIRDPSQYKYVTTSNNTDGHCWHTYYSIYLAFRQGFSHL